jgi:hypothetical protein
MTLYLLKLHLQTFLCITMTQKCQILSCDTLVANERCNEMAKIHFHSRKISTVSRRLDLCRYSYGVVCFKRVDEIPLLLSLC